MRSILGRALGRFMFPLIGFWVSLGSRVEEDHTQEYFHWVLMAILGLFRLAA